MVLFPKIGYQLQVPYCLTIFWNFCFRLNLFSTFAFFSISWSHALRLLLVLLPKKWIKLGFYFLQSYCLQLPSGSDPMSVNLRFNFLNLDFGFNLFQCFDAKPELHISTRPGHPMPLPSPLFGVATIQSIHAGFLLFVSLQKPWIAVHEWTGFGRFDTHCAVTGCPSAAFCTTGCWSFFHCFRRKSGLLVSDYYHY